MALFPVRNGHDDDEPKVEQFICPNMSIAPADRAPRAIAEQRNIPQVRHQVNIQPPTGTFVHDLCITGTTSGTRLGALFRPEKMPPQRESTHFRSFGGECCTAL